VGFGVGVLGGGMEKRKGMREWGMEHEIGGLRNGLMAAMAAMMSCLRRGGEIFLAIQMQMQIGLGLAGC
jgi:hypothetical protein